MIQKLSTIKNIWRYGLPYFTPLGWAVVFAAGFAVGWWIWFYTLSIRGL